ncbi:MAG: serine hydrolase [Solirubrobacteraceae bacterium]
MAVSAPQAGGIARVFEDAGCSGQLCVQAEVGNPQVGLQPDAPVVAASVIKLLIAVEAQRQFASGRLDPRERVSMPEAQRTPGPTGFSLYEDEIEASARDLVVAMLTISDNVATDALLARLGIAACNETARSLGLTGTVIVSDLRTMIDGLAHAAGFARWPDLAAQLARATPDELETLQDRVHACAALDPQRATRTTARDMCRLLRAIWSDRAAPADGCATLRGLMSRQLTRERLAAAFQPPVRVSAKSGGLVGVVRNEVGVIDYPDGRWYAAAVFTQANSSSAGSAAINAAIGQAAAKAIGVLRSTG